MSNRILCFGEILLRLSSPAREILLQSPRFDVTIAGAEANVAVALAFWGHSASMLTVLPDSPLGGAVLGELRRHGVNTDRVQRKPGRMGLYYLEAGALHRAPEITYDRAQSAFANAPAAGFDWDKELAGMGWLHISGVTPAVGVASAQAAGEAMRAARRLGVSTSFDCNHRAKLWSAWKGDARAVLGGIIEHTDILFATDRDIGALLGGNFDSVPAGERAQHAAGQVFARFPRVQRMYGTVRTERSVDDHSLSAQLCTAQRHFSTATYELRPIVDRIGTGDAFAAGVLHGLVSGFDEQRSLDFGIASACLKHSIPGDFNLVRVDQVEALLAAQGFGVRR
ncbi:MAG TPA: sugar kinase [Steroidobacteraceae bacterium]|nr:sugar kinase [Steroidobacteraceae bacterium]